MRFDNSTEALMADEAAARRTSAVLVCVAGVSLLLNCLLTSPPGYSEKHKADTSFFRTVVSALALTGPSAERGAFPTARGVEIRNLVFFAGAALLCIVGGLRLATCRARPSMTSDDAWDWRQRIRSPYFWWAVLLGVSLLTSMFSHARDVSLGGVAIRFLHAAWWWPLAVLLAPVHARRLMAMLVFSITLCALVGIWYLSARSAPTLFQDLAAFRLPSATLEYPIGNALWFGACILPAVFVAMGLGLDSFSRPAGAARTASGTTGAEGSASCSVGECRPCRTAGVLALVALPIVALALALTQSRSSAWVGLGGGVFCVIFLRVRRAARPAVALAAIVSAIALVWYVQGLRQHGETGDRSHSIRSRLNHEWPYAIELFRQKPVGGSGEGGYTMLAPQIGRLEQLDEPSVLAFLEQTWYSHAHNEFLELLADLGIVGAVSFIMALGVTLFYAARYCERAAADGAGRPHRWLVIGLASALFAMILEECSSVALRQPGFPPIFLTVWAVLWALVRRERLIAPAPSAESAPTPAPETAAPTSPRLSAAWLRGAGVVAVLGGGLLGYLGVQDWRAIRALFESRRALAAGDTATAARGADFAATFALDTMQKLLAMHDGVSVRSRMFAQALADNREPSDADLDIAQDAWMRLNRLGSVAPRFLRSSELAAEIALNTAMAFRARGDQAQEAEYLRIYRGALLQWHEDDPFNAALVRRMWMVMPDAPAMQRLTWLRRLMRRGEMNEPTRMMLEDLFRRMRESTLVLNELGLIAQQDLNERYAQWQDPLSPETFRVSALLKDWAGQPETAVKLAADAEQMYARAGTPLFAAHAAAIREGVIYALHIDPFGRTDELLKRLVEAHVTMERPLSATGDAAIQEMLPFEIGLTRALVLAAGGREDDAKAQLAYLESFRLQNPQAPVATLGEIYATLAEQFGVKPRFADHALQWALKARALSDENPGVYFTLLGLYLNRGEDAAAEEAARQFIEHMPNRDNAYTLLQNRERRSPDRPVWAKLRAAYPDYPELPIESAPLPTSQPTSGPAETAPASQPAAEP